MKIKFVEISGDVESARRLSWAMDEHCNNEEKLFTRWLIYNAKESFIKQNIEQLKDKIGNSPVYKSHVLLVEDCKNPELVKKFLQEFVDKEFTFANSTLYVYIFINKGKLHPQGGN